MTQAPASQATEPKLPRRRRWRQFGLRSFMLFVLATAVLAALVARPIADSRREARAIEALEKLGAQVQTRYVGDGLSDVLRLLIGDQVYRRAHSVRLSNIRVRDADLKPLAGLARLKQLQLDSTGIGNDGLSHLKELSELETLDLASTRIDDQGMMHLGGLVQLRELDLRHTNVGDAGLQHLENASNLLSLQTFGTKCTYSGLERLEHDRPLASFCEERAIEEIRALKGQIITLPAFHGNEILPYQYAEHLHLMDSKLTDADMRHLAYLRKLQLTDVPRTLSDEGFEVFSRMQSKPTLVSLDVYFSGLTDAGMKHIGQLTSLKHLAFSQNEVSDAGLEHLAGLKQLERLSFSVTKVNGAGLGHLRELPKLKSSSINYYEADERGIIHKPLRETIAAATAGLAHLKDFPALEVLKLDGQVYSDDAVEHLARVRRLKKLDISGASMSPDGVQTLREALPNCQIEK